MKLDLLEEEKLLEKTGEEVETKGRGIVGLEVHLAAENRVAPHLTLLSARTGRRR